MTANPRRFLARLWAILRKGALDADFDAELASHIDMLVDDLVRNGLTPAEARRQARLKLGGLDVARELHRDTRGLPWLEDLARDCRHAIRSLARNPGFAAALVFTLALGLTVNATVFSFVSELFLRPLPATEPDRLVVITQKIPEFQYNLPLSYPDFEDFRRQVDADKADVPELAQTLAGIMAYKEEEVHLSQSGEGTERAWIHLASNNYFSLLGLQPQLGRLFLATEGVAPGADPIIVLTDACWRGRFRADPTIVGRQVNLNGVPFTVVGVTAPGVVGAAWGTALGGFVPITMHPQLSPARKWMILSRGDTACFLVGRLQPGVTVDQAQAAARLMMTRLVHDHPDHHAPTVEMVVWPENRSRPSPFVASYMPMVISALMGLACLVLVVAAANVANLLYARAADRERELALRGALGASRSRLLRHLLSESLLLALVAAAVGIAAARAVQPALMRLVSPTDFAPPASTGMDWRPYAFTFVAAAITGVLAGLLPALKSTRLEVLPLLRGGTPSIAGFRHPWRSLLVVGQVAASCVVLVCAGLAVRSLHELAKLHLGFQPDHLLMASLDLDRQRYTPDEGARFQAELRERVQALPGVVSAAFGRNAPFDTDISQKGDITEEGRPPRPDGKFNFTPWTGVDHRYVATAGMSIAEGRDFTEHDTADRPPVALVSLGLARYLWPDESAVGKRIVFNQGETPTEIVGVLGDSRFWNLTSPAQRFMFFPLSQQYQGRVRLLVRTERDPSVLAPVIQQTVQTMDPDLPLFGVRTMEDQLANSPNARMPLRVGSLIAGGQGAVALVLAALGVFGLVSFAATRRTREIGIRMAMGADAVKVIGLVTRDGLRLVAIGLVLGLLLALGITRPLAGMLYGVGSTDWIVFITVPALVLLVAALACWLPARRATRVDPMIALRAE